VLELEEAAATHTRPCPNPGHAGEILEFAPGVPNAVLYPLKAIMALGYREYFSCTFAYQIALAIYEGYTEIGLYGIELFNGSPRERLLERACVEYWIGVAQGRGITINEFSGLAKQHYLYGYHYDQELKFGNNEVDRLVKVKLDIDAYRAAVSSALNYVCPSPLTCEDS